MALIVIGALLAITLPGPRGALLGLAGHDSGAGRVIVEAGDRAASWAAAAALAGGRLAEAAMAAAEATLPERGQRAGLVAGALLLGGLALGSALGRRGADRRLAAAVARAEALARGDVVAPVAGLERQDLSGALARATAALRVQLSEAKRQDGEVRAALAAARRAAAEARSAEESLVAGIARILAEECGAEAAADAGVAEEVAPGPAELAIAAA